MALFLGVGLYESLGPKFPVEWPPRHLGYGIGAALALYGLAGAELKDRLNVPRALVVLGGASYSRYLVHVVVLLFVRQAAGIVQPYIHMPVEMWFFVGVVSAVCGGVMFSLHVEQPLLRRLNRWRRPVAPAQALP